MAAALEVARLLAMVLLVVWKVSALVDFDEWSTAGASGFELLDAA